MCGLPYISFSPRNSKELASVHLVEEFTRSVIRISVLLMKMDRRNFDDAAEAVYFVFISRRYAGRVSVKRAIRDLLNETRLMSKYLPRVIIVGGALAVWPPRRRSTALRRR
jgi:hypothetical protein